MSEADKMFEELFYKKTADNIDFIEYTNTITKFIIRFWKRRKTLYLMDEANIRLQKIIFEKLKELGWLDDKC